MVIQIYLQQLTPELQATVPVSLVILQKMQVEQLKLLQHSMAASTRQLIECDFQCHPSDTPWVA